MTFKASSSTSLLNLTTLTECDAVPGSYFEHDPSNYTAEQLKRWLKCRGLKQTGKRQVLVQRVSDCIKSGNHRSLDVSIDGGKWLAAKIMGTKHHHSLQSQRQIVKISKALPLVTPLFFQYRLIEINFNLRIFHHILSMDIFITIA